MITMIIMKEVRGMVFDSHAHYNDAAFDADRYEILGAMRENNIGYIMNACSDLSEMEDILGLCGRFDGVYGSVGIHPEAARVIDGETEKKIRSYASNSKIKAIGEIGLDYHYEEVPRAIQKDCFGSQVKIAVSLDMPVIIHDREAHGDCLDIIRANREARGVFHCFSGSREMAREVLDLGFYIAFGGSLTFKNNVKTPLAAEYTPLDRLLIETDCPYLAPVPVRGKRNSSLNLKYVIEKLSQIKGVSPEEIENASCENAKRLFNIA